MSNKVDEWSYSSDAINVLDKFHGAKFVVYVEGQHDVIFWSSLFDKSGISGYYIEHADGKSELEKIMSQIIHDNARVIVACDAHYSLLLDTLPNHDRIISTFGHSIENTMYCPHIINRVIRKFSNDPQEQTSFITNWYITFCASAKLLLVYDLAREKYGKPVKVYGDSCTRFLTAHQSYNLDDTKIKNHIVEIKPHFRAYEIKASKRLIDQSSFEIRHIINGHFITNAIINLIKASVKRLTGKRPVIPVDNLYALTSDDCIPCTHECYEFVTHRDRITRAVESLMLIH